MTSSNTTQENELIPGGDLQRVYLVPNHSNMSDDELDFREIWQAIWNAKAWIIAATVLFTVAGIIIALSLPNVYRSEALLAPAAESQGGGLSALAGQFGGLANLAGIDLLKGDTDKVTIALEVLQSRSFIGEFIKSHDLLVPLMAASSWDIELDQLVIDDDIYDPTTKTWVRDVDPPSHPKPSDLEAYDEFSRILNVSKNAGTGLITISLDFYSPTLAKQWVDWLVIDLNNYMRQKDLYEAEQTIEYLKEQLKNTSIADMQAIFYQLIEEQTKTIMLAKVRKDYILNTIDPAVIPEQKISPNRFLIIFLGSLTGMFISFALVVIDYLRRGL